MKKSDSRINGFFALTSFIGVTLILAMHACVPRINGKNETWFQGAYIFVEYLFILGGFHLKTDKYAGGGLNPYKYIAEKYKKWIPIVAVGDALIIFITVLRGTSVKGFLKLVARGMYDCSLIGALMTTSGYLNGTTWFLSAYLWAGALIVYILSRKEIKHPKLLLGCGSAVIYLCFIMIAKSIDTWWECKLGFATCDALPRAFAGMALGVFLRHAADRLRDRIFSGKNSRALKYAIRFITWAAFLCSVLCSHLYARTYFDYVCIACFSIAILGNAFDDNYLASRVTDYLKGIQVYFYVFQVFALRCIQYFMFDMYTQLWQVAAPVCITFALASAAKIFMPALTNQGTKIAGKIIEIFAENESEEGKK